MDKPTTEELQTLAEYANEIRLRNLLDQLKLMNKRIERYLEITEELE